MTLVTTIYHYPSLLVIAPAVERSSAFFMPVVPKWDFFHFI